MNNRKLLIGLFSLLCVLLSLHAQGQTYYNFILGGINYTPGASLVRCIDNERAIAFYDNSSSTVHNLALIDIYGNVRGTKLNNDYILRDIQIVGDDVYFCGSHNHTNGFIGHVRISDLENMTPHVTYHNLSIVYASIVTGMAAYRIATGTKIVGIGYKYYLDTSIVYGTCPSMYDCHGSFIIECDASGATLSSPIQLKVVGYQGGWENPYDIVETDNYVAVLSYRQENGRMVIHRCAKNNVLGTFNNYHHYTIAYEDGFSGYLGCKMQDDTIAVVALASATGQPPYETQMRTYDLNTMSMVHAQSMAVVDKVAPSGMVYMPEYKTLVMLQRQPFPTPWSNYHDTFLNWEPYRTTSYNMQGMYESVREYKYYALDRLAPKDFVATGGDFWIEAEIYHKASTCYTMDSVQVTLLQRASPMLELTSYPQGVVGITTEYSNDSYSGGIVANCVTN